jgi:hypothetical protein
MRSRHLRSVGDDPPGHLHRDERIAVDVGVRGDAEILGALDEVGDRTVEGESAG